MVVVVKSEPLGSNGGAGNFTVFAYAYCFNDAMSGLKIWNSQYYPETDFHIFVRGGGWINIWGGAAASFGRGLVATHRKAKEKV